MDGERPASSTFLEGGDRELVLGESIGDFPSGCGIADEPCDHGGSVNVRRLGHGAQVLIPDIHRTYAGAAADDSQNGQQLIRRLSTASPVGELGFGPLLGVLFKPQPLFCTELSSALRSRSTTAKAVDLALRTED